MRPSLPTRRCRSAGAGAPTWSCGSCCCTACLGCARARRARHHGGADRHAGRRPGHLIIHKAIPFTEEETRGGAEPCGRDEDLICVSLTKPAWRGILVTAAKDGRARGPRYGYAVDRSTLAQLDGHGALLSVAGNARAATLTGRPTCRASRAPHGRCCSPATAGPGPLAELAAQILAL